MRYDQGLWHLVGAQITRRAGRARVAVTIGARAEGAIARAERGRASAEVQVAATGGRRLRRCDKLRVAGQITFS